MDSKQKQKAPVPIQADADHEVVTTPLDKLYQTNPPSKNRSSWRLLELEAFGFRPVCHDQQRPEESSQGWCRLCLARQVIFEIPFRVALACILAHPVSP